MSRQMKGTCCAPPRRKSLLILSVVLTAWAALSLTACGRVPDLLSSSQTPTVTLPPTLTPSQTPTPAPTPTMTPIPPARIESGDQAMFAGDWSRAAAEYQAVLAQSDDPALRSAAQLGLAKARLYSGDLAGAQSDLADFLAEFPDSAQAADAHFLAAEAHRAAGEWPLAIEAYRRYQSLRPGVIDSYVEEAIALSAASAGDHAAAAEAYRAAIAAPRTGDAFNLRERLALSLAALGDTDGALAEYEAVYQATNQNWRKAHVAVAAGQLLYAAGRAEEAYAKYLDAVNNYPESADSFQGLLTLVNDGVPVDDLQRGLTNYFAQNYAPALAAFDRHIAANPGAGAAALFYKGQTLSALGESAEAIAVFRQIVEGYPSDPLWARAYQQIAFIQPYPQDVQTFQDFVAAAPQSALAPDSLYRAARLCERNGDFGRAAALWTRIALEYPQAEQAADAAIQAGIVLYRGGEVGTAGQRFELAASLGSDPAQHARAWLWIGKVHAKHGDRLAAREAWAKASELDPHGYYSLRAGQLLRGTAPFTPPRGYSFDFDFEAERQQVEIWLRATFPAAQAIDQLSELQPGVWQEPRFVRGAELWRLGRLLEAHAEFNSLRLDLTGDPLAMWQLALYFNQIGAYDLSIRSARSVVDGAGYADTLLAPRLILRLRYPAPFPEYVVAASQEYDLHPFLMLSKMRIESFFWKYALSSAEARGLNQIIPPTAGDIASRLGLADFTLDDLYRPAVSIPMGAYYLSYVGSLTDDDPASVLAGYYAGPGNAQIWKDMAEDDPDLFVEVIRLPDARGYVQTVYEYFWVYAELYGS